VLDLNDIADFSAIARDIAFVVVCVVATVATLLILVSVRKAIRRINEAMARVEDILDSVAAARDSLVEMRNRIQNRSSKDGEDSGGRFNVVTWLLTPLGHAINRQFRKRSRGESEETR
jgi:uncharacterized membrane protein YhiD involved in acid resistance